MRNPLKTLSRLFEAEAAPSLASGDGALLELLSGAAPTAAGVAVSTAMRHPAAACAIRIIAGAVATLPIITYRRGADGGHPWTPDGFRVYWRKACVKAGVLDMTFNDLRGTAVTRLALASATEAEIATISGRGLGDVRSVLYAHDLNRDPALDVSAIQKLERRTNFPD